MHGHMNVKYLGIIMCIELSPNILPVFLGSIHQLTLVFREGGSSLYINYLSFIIIYFPLI
jgi:hypothetical protein